MTTPHEKGNFTKVPNYIIRSQLNPTARSILLVLLSNEEGFPVSVSSLSKLLGFDKRTIQKEFKTLREARLLISAGMKHNRYGPYPVFTFNHDEALLLHFIAKRLDHLEKVTDEPCESDVEGLHCKPANEPANEMQTKNTRKKTSPVQKIKDRTVSKETVEGIEEAFSKAGSLDSRQPGRQAVSPGELEGNSPCQPPVGVGGLLEDVGPGLVVPPKPVSFVLSNGTSIDCKFCKTDGPPLRQKKALEAINRKNKGCNFSLVDDWLGFKVAGVGSLENDGATIGLVLITSDDRSFLERSKSWVSRLLKETERNQSVLLAYVFAEKTLFRLERREDPPLPVA